ncbi:hypothetical protein BLL42_28265 (plasmid) [Pseudomonas frederiksbergensis]|uniref:cyclic-guanylate-specific phosphodiesterase n=2 Tax=Pseudomonas frederiksbergensis TaxID=104087 RepID=A0A1J0EUX2_9PSED|nr:hypothetical protein BLL42_28265 [Pseudomonas frederiksbergensis]
MVLAVSIALTEYLVGHYFTHLFERTRSFNASQLVEMRNQISRVFEQLHDLDIFNQEQGNACRKEVFLTQAALVDANRFIYETALKVDGGGLCSSYGSESGGLSAFAFEQSHAGYPVNGNGTTRTYWFNAGVGATLDAGEILIRENRVHVRINKGILLDALALDKNVSFALFERGKPVPVLANHAIDYSAEAVATPETIVRTQDAVFYAYPVKWSDLVALISVPAAYYKTVWGWLLLLCVGTLAALFFLLVYTVSRVYRLKFSLRAKLKNALKESQLQMFYQPIVDMRSGEVMGAEALMRWTLDDRSISPVEFIPLAEANGMIVELTEWCCEQVAKDMSVLLSCTENKYVSINLSSVALAAPDIAKKLHNILLRFEIRPAQFVFEITESFTVAGESAQAQLYYLHDLGYKIALDDFGAGSSNLAYLERLPVDIIKIDKSFVTLDKMYSADTMWWHIIRIARSLDLVVIAEGIEGREQVNPLLDVGVKYAQGYYYFKPMPAEQFIGIVTASAGRDAGSNIPVARLDDTNKFEVQ